MVIMDKSRPLLLRSLLEATLVTVVYLYFLKIWAERWMSASIFQTVWISPPIYATLLYIGFVYFGRGSFFFLLIELLGVMENYTPFSTRIFELMIAYNIYQTALNAFCFFAFAYEVYRSETMTLIGNTTVSYYIRLMMWIHYNNK